MSKHDKTVAAIFTNPVSGTIKWQDVEALFGYFGAEIISGKGSSVKVILNGQTLALHRPHPRPEIAKWAVKLIRIFLLQAGIRP